MAYADNIDVNAPADSDLLSLGDDAIRKLARAVAQRLGALLIDPDADPPKLAQDVISDGSVTTDNLQDGAVTKAKLASDAQPLKFLRFGTVSSGTLAGGASGVVLLTGLAGVAAGDVAIVNVDDTNNAQKLITTGYVSNDGEVTVRIYNPGGSDITYSTAVNVAVVKLA